MPTKKKKHAEHEAEHADERWLITYADMITLLMVLFIVLYSISQVDLAKFKQLKSGLSESFNAGGDGVLDGGSGVLDGGNGPSPEILAAASKALAEKQAVEQAATAERDALQAAEQRIVGELAGRGLAGDVGFRLERRGLVVTIVTDDVLFDPGSAVLRADGRQVVDALAAALAPLPNMISIEGHTDSTPTRGGRGYPTNWELSTARATTVLRELAEGHGFDARRLSAAGYADTRPLAANDTPQGRATNRRVEIVVHSTTGSEEVA